MNFSPIELIVAERVRQIEVEDHLLAHDDEHTEGQMALLAAAYAMSSWAPISPTRSKNTTGYMVLEYVEDFLRAYGWNFKPKDPIRDLVRAGALILAELERQMRNTGKGGSDGRY